MTFYLTPTKTWIYDNGEKRCGQEPRTTSGNWFLEGFVLNTGSDNYVSKLNQDTLIWVYHPGGQQDATRETFIHPDLSIKK